MKLLPGIVALLFVGTCIVPLAFASSSSSDNNRGPAPSGAQSRAEPELNGTGNHSRSAVYDFSNTFMFSRWSVVMETNQAKLMKNLKFTSDVWATPGPFPDGVGRAGNVAVWDTVSNKAIVLGGYNWNSSLSDRVYDQPVFLYDPSTNAWTTLGPSKIPAGSAGAWDPIDRCVLVCGGTDSASGRTGVRNETWAFFPSNSTWARLADMPQARHGQSAVWDPDEKLLLVFGGTGGTDYYNDVWSFNYASNRWTNLTIVADEYPLTRAYTSAVWNPLKREMLIHGGLNAGITFLSTWAYSFQNATWVHRTSAPFARYVHTAGFDAQRGVMTVFGAGEYDYTDTWTYDVESDSWAANKILPGALRTAAAGVFDPVSRSLLLFGGRDTAGDCLNETRALTLGAMSGTYFSPGYMQPPPLEFGENFHSVDKVSWTQDLPAGTNITLRTRASDDNISWGSWEDVQNGGKPFAQGKFMQWNVSFTASPDLRSTPRVTGATFEYTVNRRPSATVGNDISAFKRQPVTLTGGGSDPDGDALAYKWNRTTPMAGTFDDDTLQAPTYTPLASGVHSLALVVNDSYDPSAPAYIKVTVENRPPTAMAGLDSVGFRGEFVNLYGDGSDPDHDPLFFNWTQVEGPAVTITPPDALKASFIPTRSGNYTFRLEASDGEDSAFAEVNVTVQNRPPVARLEASPSRTGVNERINFSAALSYDPDGNVTKYLIDFGDGNDTGWTAKPEIGYYYTAPGFYHAWARVMDDEGKLSERSENLTITVRNALPVVNISVTPLTGDFRTMFRFTVSSSSFDPDGSIVSYDWKFGDGATDMGSAVSHNFSRPGRYAVIMRATDDSGGFSEANLTVVVGNVAPEIISTAPARLFIINLGAQAAFSVVARDPEGGPLSYSWKIDDVAAGVNSPNFTYRPTTKGERRLCVTVSDGESSVSYEWGVSVRPKSAAPPKDEGFPAVTAGILVAVAAMVAVIGFLAMRPKR